MSSAQIAKSLPSPADRRRRNREEVVNAILETSRAIIREHGAAGLNLNEVARRLGIKTPSLYEYFPNKMAIYDALFRRGIHMFGQRMEQNPSENVSVWDRLHFTMDACMAFAHENPELYQIIFERPVPGFVPSEEGMRECTAALAYLSDGLSQALAAGFIKTDLTPDQAYYLVGAVMHGLTALHIANEPQLPVGYGRFGSLIPAAVAVFRAAWEAERSDS
jgi:AcrR family transcriptional regulator